jgi:hypothetical protein
VTPMIATQTTGPEAWWVCAGECEPFT